MIGPKRSASNWDTAVGVPSATNLRRTRERVNVCYILFIESVRLT